MEGAEGGFGLTVGSQPDKWPGLSVSLRHSPVGLPAPGYCAFLWMPSFRIGSCARLDRGRSPDNCDETRTEYLKKTIPPIVYLRVRASVRGHDLRSPNLESFMKHDIHVGRDETKHKVPDDQVGLAVPVEVCRDHCDRRRSRGKKGARESSVPVVEQ